MGGCRTLWTKRKAAEQKKEALKIARARLKNIANRTRSRILEKAMLDATHGLQLTYVSDSTSNNFDASFDHAVALQTRH